MNNATLIEHLEAAFPGKILGSSEFRDLTFVVDRDAVIDVARHLRDTPELSFNALTNLCGVDYLGRDPRFEVVYHLLSYANRRRVCLKVGLPESDPVVPSLTGLWLGANWHERETFDMFGIQFAGHPNLERILMPDDWQGHPLRKDVPLGEEEVAFTFNEERIYARKPFARD
jgi:NADH-quinone oxidoreductase subunit C